MMSFGPGFLPSATKGHPVKINETEKLRMPREQHLQPRGQFPRLCLKTKILGGNDLFITSNP